MGFEYYVFALFITGLLCLLAVLCRLLFGGMRRRQKLLDEKEESLLKLYNTVESIIEDFTDQSRAAIEEIKELESRAAMKTVLAAPNTATGQAPSEPSAKEDKEPVQKRRASEEGFSTSQSMKVDSSRIRAAGEVLERAERMIKSSAQKTAPAPARTGGGAVFQRIIDEAVEDIPDYEDNGQANQQKTTHSRILEMSQEGKSVSQIARSLGITQNEVMLVIGLDTR